MILRKFLLTASAMLCGAFLLQLGLSIHEQMTWPVPKPDTIQFAVDAFPQYTVGLFHGLSFLLLPAIVFAKRYFFALALSIGYLLLHAFATQARICAGFLGGDFCPDGGMSYAAIFRAGWFDWFATFLLLLIIGLTAAIVVRNSRFRLD